MVTFQLFRECFECLRGPVNDHIHRQTPVTLNFQQIDVMTSVVLVKAPSRGRTGSVIANVGACLLERAHIATVSLLSHSIGSDTSRRDRGVRRSDSRLRGFDLPFGFLVPISMGTPCKRTDRLGLPEEGFVRKHCEYSPPRTSHLGFTSWSSIKSAKQVRLYTPTEDYPMSLQFRMREVLPFALAISPPCL